MCQVDDGVQPCDRAKLSADYKFQGLSPHANFANSSAIRLCPGLQPLGTVQQVVDGEQALAFEHGVESVGNVVLL